MNTQKKRIESIDALRAFALLGILLVHTSQLFNFYNEYNDFSYFTNLGINQIDFIRHYFQNRFVILFSILFGTSFYLILNNPTYSRKKFCWRCVLLILFGLINKLIYTTDVLVWYGLNGIILSMFPVKKLSAQKILILAIIAYALSFQGFINFGDIVSPLNDYTQRYLIANGIRGILIYPYIEILKEDIHMFWNLGSVTLAYFLMGYYFGKSRIIENIDKVIGFKIVVSFFLLFIITSLVNKYTGYHFNGKKICNLIAALFYAVTFIYSYNRLRRFFSFMSSYGKLGLTHYSTQNALLPIITSLILVHTKFSFEYILIVSLLFYAIQSFFSILWMRKYKYGPFEYVWRILTNRQYISNIKQINNPT